MIDYRARVVIPEPTSWRPGITVLWDGLRSFSEHTSLAFALALCPERPNALTLGTEGLIDFQLLREHIRQAADDAGVALLVEEGLFRTERPLGSEQLVTIRDEVRHSMFDEMACLMGKYSHDSLSRLVPVAETFLLLDRINWVDGMRLWPLSLKGHLWAFEKTGGNAVKQVRQIGETLVPSLSLVEQEQRIFDHSQPLSHKLGKRLQHLQCAYDSIRRYVSMLSTGERQDLSEEAGNLLENILSATHSAEEARRIAIHPNHMSYRIFMSMIYDLAPLIALPTSRKLIAFHAVIELLQQAHPGLMAKANESGNQLSRATP